MEILPEPSAPTSESILLDIKGAARALSSSVWAVRALIWNQKIPYIRLGRKFLIDPTDLREFVRREKTMR
jgi:excisionase family DNA binding protein